MSVRTRFAPSPTGYLHIGGVRTALFNWLFARQHGGQFILRIDDTDQQRNVEEALQPILDGLHWLGIDWDEGPEVGGPFAPYYQSQRLDRYQAAVQKLLSTGHAYYDYATPEELKEERESAEREKRSFRYSRRFMAETPEERAKFESQGRQAVVRLKMFTEGTLVLDDLVRGRVSFEWASEQDHVIQRTDGSCLYHLANVVDDFDLQISHVIRAEEHLSNTPRQVFILEALSYPRPVYAHLPFVAEPGSRNKLSKRKLDKYLKNRDFAQLVEHGRKIAQAIGHAVEADAFNPVIVDFYRTVGYLPEAIINYMALLGWSLDDKTEHFSRQELIEKFTLERVNKAPASFDPKKLQAFEDWHFQQLTLERKVALVTPFLEKAGLDQIPLETRQARLKKLIMAAGNRIKVAGDILDYKYFFLPDGIYNLDQTLLKKHISTLSDVEILQTCRKVIEQGRHTSDDLVLRRTLEQHACTTIQSSNTSLPLDIVPEGISQLAEKVECGEMTIEDVESKFGQIMALLVIEMKELHQKLRVALTGSERGLDVRAIVDILGPKSSTVRIERAIRTAEVPEQPEQSFNQRIMTLPEALREEINFSDISKPFELYDGELVVKYSDMSISGKGRLELQLAPNIAIRFSVEPKSIPQSPIGEAILQIPSYNLNVPVLVIQAKSRSDEKMVLSGVPNGRIVVGGGEDISSLIFHVTDFHDYIGGSIRDDTGHHLWQGRLNLTARDWRITIDAVSDLSERRDAAAQNGGVPVTHTGEVYCRDGGPFTSSDCDELLSLLQCFLSFVRGRWVAPLIATGFDRQGNRVWQDWTLWRIAEAPAFESWCPVHDMSFVEKLFPRFYERWMNPAWREFLRPVISSYLQGNKQGLLDDSIIFAQIVLEMIADFVLVEQPGLHTAGATDTNAEDRLSLLFQRIPIPIEIPESLADLDQFVKTMGLSSGLEAITCIRNACVHHNAEGRRIITSLTSKKHAFYDVSRLALWYTDLCILWLLGYEGRYQSRVHAKWVGETEAVPWTTPLEYPLKKLGVQQ